MNSQPRQAGPDRIALNNQPTKHPSKQNSRAGHNKVRQETG